VWWRNTFAVFLGLLRVRSLGSCIVFGSHYVSYLRLARGPCNTQATQDLIPPHEVGCAWLHVTLDSVSVGMRLEVIFGILLFFVTYLVDEVGGRTAYDAGNVFHSGCLCSATLEMRHLIHRPKYTECQITTLTWDVQPSGKSLLKDHVGTYYRTIAPFCNLAGSARALAYLWLVCLLCLVSRSVIATFTGVFKLLRYPTRSTHHPHQPTGHFASKHGQRSSTFETMDSAIESNISSQDSRFLALAEELVLSVTSHIQRKDLCALALVSKKCHRLVTPLIWKDVELIDCRATTDPTTGHRFVTYGPATATHRGRNIPAGTKLSSDEHDDTPLIKILLVLAT
jgi:hypothetical protein